MAFFGIRGGGGSGANILKGSTEPASAIGQNGDIYFQYINFVKSIKSLDFTQGGIFLPVEGKLSTRFVMNFKMTGGSIYACPLGSRLSNNSRNFLLFTKYNGANIGYYGMDGTDTLFGDTSSYFNKDLTLDISCKKIILTDGTNSLEATPTNTKYLRTYRMCVGAMGNNDASIDGLTYCEMNCYGVDVYDNDKFLYKFIPAQDNGINGLLEVFSSKFYSATGTVSSTAMEEQQDESIIFKTYIKHNGEWENLIGYQE